MIALALIAAAAWLAHRLYALYASLPRTNDDMIFF